MWLSLHAASNLKGFSKTLLARFLEMHYISSLNWNINFDLNP